MSTCPSLASPHRSLPRKKRPPSLRDQAIYAAYRTTGQTQAKLAEDNHLSQRRISQIIRRVEVWIVQSSGSKAEVQGPKSKVQSDDGPTAASTLDLGPWTLDPNDQLRLERCLQRARDQAIFDRAIRAFDSDPRELNTTKKGHRDGKEFAEQTCRQRQADVQLLKTALRASGDLGRLAERKPLPPVEKSPEERREQIEAWLGEIFQAAEADNPALTDDTGRWLARDLMRAVLGETSTGITVRQLVSKLGWEVDMYPHAKQPPRESAEHEADPCAAEDAPGSGVDCATEVPGSGVDCAIDVPSSSAPSLNPLPPGEGGCRRQPGEGIGIDFMAPPAPSTASIASVWAPRHSTQPLRWVSLKERRELWKKEDEDITKQHERERLQEYLALLRQQNAENLRQFALYSQQRA